MLKHLLFNRPAGTAHLQQGKVLVETPFILVRCIVGPSSDDLHAIFHFVMVQVCHEYFMSQCRNELSLDTRERAADPHFVEILPRLSETIHRTA